MASRRAACLIAAGQSAAVVLEDMSKAIQVKLYSKDNRDLACLAAIGIGGSRLSCALNRAGHLPSEDVSRGHCRWEPPLCPNQAPKAEFIVSCVPTTDRPLLWDVVTDEIFLDAMVGVTHNMNASGVCTPCCATPFPLWPEEQIDFLVAQLGSEDHVHLGEYGTIISIAAHNFDHYRGIPLWQVTSCNRFTHEQVRWQREHIMEVLPEALRSSGRLKDRVAAYCTDGDTRRSKETLLSYYRGSRSATAAAKDVALPFFVVMDDGLGLMVDFDNVHITKRLRNSFLAGNIIITNVPLTPQTLQALGKHVNIDIDDVISRGKADW